MGQKEKEAANMAAADGRCIICGETSDLLHQGLCSKHYQRWRRYKLKKKREGATADDLARLDAQMIEDGTLLPNKQGQRRVKAVDAMEESFAKFEGRKTTDSTADVEKARELSKAKKRTPAKRSS